MRCLSLAASVLTAMAINPQEAQASKIAADAAVSFPPPADVVAGGSGGSPKTAKKHTTSHGVVPSDLHGSDENVADILGRSLEAVPEGGVARKADENVRHRRKLEGTNDWVFGGNGLSCNEVCDADGRGGCTPAGLAIMNSVDTDEEMIFVASQVGKTCGEVKKSSWSGNPYWHPNNWCALPLDGVSTCAAKYGLTTRICCCGESPDCPLEAPPTTAAPSTSPTTSPTAEAPWKIEFLELIANFTALSYEDLKLSYAVGKGRDYEAFLFQKDCETNITDIAITSNKIRESKNDTFDFLSLNYNVSKDEIMNSTIWNSTSSAIEVCQVVNLIVPASNGMDKFVLATDVVKTNITFDLTAEIELLVDLQAGAVDNATETIDVADVVEACKCSEDSFDCNSETLAPNNELFTCVYSTDASIQVDTLVTMDIEQGSEKLQVVENDVAKIPGLTSVEFIDGGVRVGTRVPVNKFNFANGASITISGAVDMKLPGLGRRLRALADDGAAAVDENEEAAFELVVNLAEEVDAGSSDQVSVTSSGRAFGVGVVVLGAVASLAVFSLW